LATFSPADAEKSIDAEADLLRSLRSFAANESVFIRVHPWLNWHESKTAGLASSFCRRSVRVFNFHFYLDVTPRNV